VERSFFGRAFFAAWFLLGIGEAPTFPANAKTIGYWFPNAERSLVTAIFDSAAKFSSAVGVPLLGILLLHFGLPWSFAATGFVSLLYFVMFCTFCRNPSDDKLLSVAEREFIAQGGTQPKDVAKQAIAKPTKIACPMTSFRNDARKKRALGNGRGEMT